MPERNGKTEGRNSGEEIIMAKQAEDLKTIELLPKQAKRGRPTSGKAMSAAERKRAQRAKDKTMLWHKSNAITDVTTEGLLLGLAECVKGGNLAVLEQITAELKARAQAAVGK